MKTPASPDCAADSVTDSAPKTLQVPDSHLRRNGKSLTSFSKAPTGSQTPVSRHTQSADELATSPLPFGPAHVPAFVPAKSGVDGGWSVVQDYILEGTIGHGAYAVVRRAYHVPTGTYYAAKVYPQASLQDPLRAKSLAREVEVLKSLNHPNVVKLHDTIETEESFYVILELVIGMPLHTFVRQRPTRCLTTSEALTVVRGVLSALAYCHAQGVSHRDIKMENIVVVDRRLNVKLLDFGFAIRTTEKFRIYCGTVNYMAPEIVTRVEYAGPPADVWATGVLLYALSCGSFPFKAAFDKEVLHRIQKLLFTLPLTLPDCVANLIRAMMSGDPDTRPTAAALLETLSEEPVALHTIDPIEESVTCEYRRVRNAAGQFVFERIEACYSPN